MTGTTRFASKDWRQRLTYTTMAALIGALVQTASLTAQAADATAKGDAEAGEDVFRRCRACHAIGPGARNRVGPMLNDLIGRKAASVPGYAYSPAMKVAGANELVWTEAVLLDYLTRPRDYVRGTKMIFAGLPEEEDRVDLVAYLKTFSKPAKK